MVSWMSGLVTGLQNRVQRFEPARDLPEAITLCGCFFRIISTKRIVFRFTISALSSTFVVWKISL